MALNLHILNTRLARNIYFWVIMVLFILALNDSTATAYPKHIYLSYKFTTLVLFAILVYTNNLILVPKYLTQRKRGSYFLSATILLLSIATAFVLLFKHMLNTYPKISIYEVSILTSPVNTDWSLSTILEEIPVYAFGLLMLQFAFTMAWYMNAYAKQERIAREAAHKQTQAELSMLRGQLNPHFLFNTLNNIYGLSLQKSDIAPEAILKLSSIMRYILYESNVDKVSVEQEKELMQAYIDMELLRLPQDSDFSFEIETDKDYDVPPLLWMPVLENVFKHGTRFIDDNLYIRYSYKIINSELKIDATNKFKAGAVGKGGVGLENLTKRLEILYPKQHSISTMQEEDTYRIHVSVNLGK